jgi:hypothetical protein
MGEEMDPSSGIGDHRPGLMIKGSCSVALRCMAVKNIGFSIGMIPMQVSSSQYFRALPIGCPNKALRSRSHKMLF